MGGMMESTMPAMFVCHVHPSVVDAWELTPQERWKLRYRAERLKRRFTDG